MGRFTAKELMEITNLSVETKVAERLDAQAKWESENEERLDRIYELMELKAKEGFSAVSILSMVTIDNYKEVEEHFTSKGDFHVAHTVQREFPKSKLTKFEVIWREDK